MAAGKREANEKFMALALREAAKGLGSVSPNPAVGAVVVKGGRVVAKGHHARFGGKHAEVVALQWAGKKARGATLYVSLEPCCHWGKQPPCVDAIVRAGVKEVVFPFNDPNPAVRGRGARALKRAGIRVRKGVLAAEARELNRGFVKVRERGLPWVTLKVAMSADGKIAGQKGKWITGREARERVQALRAVFDAVLVGRKTVEKDNPRLTVRKRGARQPLRVVLDASLKLPATRKVFSWKGKTLVFASTTTPKKRAEKFRGRNVEVAFVGARREKADLRAVSRELVRRGVCSVMVEGGAEVFNAFLGENLADEVLLFVAPREIGERGLDAFTEKNWARVGAAMQREAHRCRVGRDVCLSIRL